MRLSIRTLEAFSQFNFARSRRREEAETLDPGRASASLPRRLRPVLLTFLVMVVVSASAQKEFENLVLVKGGPFKNTRSTNYFGKTISSFYIGKYEVTQKEWTEVMRTNPSQFKG